MLPPKPRIADGAGAKAWLAGMAHPVTVANLVEITEVLAALGAGGDEPGAAALAADRKLAVADRIRVVLSQVLADRARDEALDALPVKDDYARAFWPAVDAAGALRDAYAWLVSRLPAVAPPGRDGAASLSQVDALHRALEVNAQILLAILRARWPVPAALWDRHCVLGQLVRDLDCQDVEVADPARLNQARTCRAAFVLPVMVALADPASKSATEFEVTRQAAQRWSLKVGFRIERRGEVGAAPARPVANPGPSVALGSYIVRFDTQSAIQSIDKRLAALAEGKSPREVGIGDALRAQPARELLIAIRQRWGAVNPQDIDSPDRPWRAVPDGAKVMVTVTMPRRSGPLGRAASLSSPTGAPDPYGVRRVEHNAITKPRTVIESERIEQLLEQAESWSLVGETRDALRCVRRHARPRLGLQRLVALKLGARDSDAPLLVGWIEALQSMIVAVDDRPTGHTDAHTVRVRLAPGMPVIVRASADEQEFDFAFLLLPRIGEDIARPRPVPAGSFFPMPGEAGRPRTVQAEASDAWQAVRGQARECGLVLPHSTFRMHRQIRAVRDGSLATLRLDELMMRGADFDLVRFTPL